MISHNGKALRRRQITQCFGAPFHIKHRDWALRTTNAYVITGENDQIRSEGVDVGNDALNKGGIRERVEVDVANLDDLEAIKRQGKIIYRQFLSNDADFVTGNLGRIEHKTSSGGYGTDQELSSAGERPFPPCEPTSALVSAHRT
jgi:hypothetical protein